MKMNLKNLQITSPAFNSLERIPDRYTSKGESVSPAIAWSQLAPETKQLALICHDPDAPLLRGFTHWVVYNIPPTVNGIVTAGGAAFTEGMNSLGESGYTGPNPPPGHGQHHYYFWLYGLDQALDLKPGLTRDQLLDEMEAHVVEQARFMGVYEL